MLHNPKGITVYWRKVMGMIKVGVEVEDTGKGAERSK